MPDKRGAAHGLLQRFPEHWDSIVDLRQSSLAFRSLCADYDAASAALRYWQDATDARAKKRAAEYRELLEELEREALRYLGETPAMGHLRKALD